MRSIPIEWFVVGALASALGCRAFDPTIPERQRDRAAQREDVGLSLDEDRPALAAMPSTFDPPRATNAAANPAAMGAHLAGDERYSFDWRNANLAQAIYQIAETAGVSVYLDPNIDRRIDVSLRNATLDEALHVVLQRNGLCLHEEPQGIFWVDNCDGSERAQQSFYVQSINAADVEPQLKQLVSGEAKLVVDAPQNLIVVRGPKSDVDLVAHYLEGADRLKRQVLVEVRILEVTLTDKFQLGVTSDIAGKWNGDTLSLMQTLGAADKSFSLGFSSGSGKVNAAIEALSRYTGVNLISSPRILAVTNTESMIEVIREVPYVKVTSTTTGTTAGVGTSTIEEVQFKDAGITLKVTPTIQEGGVVHLKVDQVFSEVVDVFKEIPVLDKRHLTSEFSVEDRGTIVFGGLMQRKRAETDGGVPGLMDLPLIGRLFRADDDQKDKRELLVFLTPRIVDPREASSLSRELKATWTERVHETGLGPSPSDKPVK